MVGLRRWQWGNISYCSVSLCCWCYCYLQCSGFPMRLYTPLLDVMQLLPSNFKSRVLNADGIMLVEFFAPWSGHCPGHCKALVPEWEKSATTLKGIVINPKHQLLVMRTHRLWKGENHFQYEQKKRNLLQ